MGYGRILKLLPLRKVSYNYQIGNRALPVSITSFKIENNAGNMNVLVAATRMDVRMQTVPAATSKGDIIFAIEKL